MTAVAVGLVLLSALLHATWNTATKGSDSPTAFMLAMEVVILIAIAPLAWWIEWSSLPLELWGLMLGTGITHALYAIWLSRAYVHGDLSLVYPIARSTPAFVPLVAVPLLGEHVSLVAALGIALVVTGVWAVQSDGRLSLRSLLSRGALYAWLTLSMTVAYSLIDKRGMLVLSAADASGPLPFALAFMVLLYVFYLPLFAPLALRAVGWREVAGVLRGELRSVVGASLIGLLSYGLILEVYRSEPVSYVVALRQTSVLFAVALGALLLRERPGRIRLLGALTTVAGITLITLFP